MQRCSLPGGLLHDHHALHIARCRAGVPSPMHMCPHVLSLRCRGQRVPPTRKKTCRHVQRVGPPWRGNGRSRWEEAAPWMTTFTGSLIWPLTLTHLLDHPSPFSAAEDTTTWIRATRPSSWKQDQHQLLSLLFHLGWPHKQSFQRPQSVPYTIC